MSDHEGFCAIEAGYNWCTCIRYAELQGFDLHLLQVGQVGCIGGHEDWWLGTNTCPWCKAAV